VKSRSYYHPIIGTPNRITNPQHKELPMLQRRVLFLIVSRIAVGAGNYEEAVKQMKLAKDAAPEKAKSQIQGLINRLEKKENINK
jgi:hypothetical protein